MWCITDGEDVEGGRCMKGSDGRKVTVVSVRKTEGKSGKST